MGLTFIGFNNGLRRFNFFSGGVRWVALSQVISSHHRASWLFERIWLAKQLSTSWNQAAWITNSKPTYDTSFIGHLFQWQSIPCHFWHILSDPSVCLACLLACSSQRSVCLALGDCLHWCLHLQVGLPGWSRILQHVSPKICLGLF